MDVFPPLFYILSFDTSTATLFSLFAVMIEAKQEHAFIPSLHREIWWQRKKRMFYVHTSKGIS